MSRIPDAESLKKVLSNVKEETVSLNRLKIWKGRLKNGKKSCLIILGLKVLSVFLAFFVWLAVVNIKNPEDSDSKEVPLDIVK